MSIAGRNPRLLYFTMHPERGSQLLCCCEGRAHRQRKQSCVSSMPQLVLEH